VTPDCERLLNGLVRWEHAEPALKEEAWPHIDEGARHILATDKVNRPVMMRKIPVKMRPVIQARLNDLLNEMVERAAIREHDGELPRAEAERLTRLDYGQKK